jgi:DNA-binding winged helix-turn-helix (wHTH) protein
MMALYSFGDFLLDTTQKRVLRDNRPVGISGMPLAILCYFVEHAADGRLVTRAELRKQLWGCKIEDVTIRSNLSVLRGALGDPVHTPRYLQTHGKEGWRLMRPATRLTTEPLSHLPPAPGSAYDPACYVLRPAEEQVLLSCLRKPGRPAVVFGPTGSGKRLLIEHTLDQAMQGAEGPIGRALRVRVSAAVDAQSGSLEAFLKELGRLLLVASGQPEEEARKHLELLWSPAIQAPQKLRELVLQLLTAGPSGAAPRPTALVLYGVDGLAGCAIRDDVFHLLRAWQVDPFLNSLRLVIETSLPPRHFPLSGQTSLWSGSHRLDVSRISLEQLSRLAELHAVYSAAAERQALGELVGWNVYLCRLALFHAAVQGASLAAVLAAYQPAQNAFGPFADHLEDLQAELESLATAGALHKPLGHCLSELVEGAALPQDTASRLLRRGLIVETENRGCFRSGCPLYADYFARQRS